MEIRETCVSSVMITTFITALTTRQIPSLPDGAPDRGAEVSATTITCIMTMSTRDVPSVTEACPTDGNILTLREAVLPCLYLQTLFHTVRAYQQPNHGKV
jgi:hypothetical protein